jgi:alpha-ketoglutarate-dependent taurine dioxygenase
VHCIKDASSGGSSTLISAIAAAEFVRVRHPRLYSALLAYPVTFIKQRPSPSFCSAASLSYTAPLVARGACGGTTSVRWAPPFEGALGVAPGLYPDFIEGYRLLEALLSGEYFMPHERVEYEWAGEAREWHDENLVSFRLQPGQAVAFNNRTLCHGRTAFETGGGGGGRWLMGSYTSVDDAANVYSVLSGGLGGGGGLFGNGASRVVAGDRYE